MTDWARLEQLAAERPHDGRRFINRYPTPHHGLREFLRWQRQTGGRFPRRLPFPLRRP
ncbi:MAG TPA: phospholipase, partial [Alcanivorax sp.]|nr:phospholipase [Alcanivorax sp.]